MNTRIEETSIKHRAFIEFEDGSRESLQPHYDTEHEAREALRDLARWLQGQDRQKGRTRPWDQARFVVEPVRVTVFRHPETVATSPPGRPEGSSASGSGSA